MRSGKKGGPGSDANAKTEAEKSDSSIADDVLTAC